MPLRIPPWAKPRHGRLPGDPEPEQVLVVPGPADPAAGMWTGNVEAIEDARNGGVAPYATRKPDPEPEPLPEGVLGYAVGVWSGGDFLGFTHTTSLSRESAEDEVACWNKRRDDARTLGAAAACWRVVEVRLP